MKSSFIFPRYLFILNFVMMNSKKKQWIASSIVVSWWMWGLYPWLCCSRMSPVMSVCSSSPPVGHFTHSQCEAEAEAFLLEWFNKIMKHSFHFPSLSYPLAWKSRDFYHCLSFMNSQPVDGIGLNTYLIGLSHLEVLGSLWLFIVRKMLTMSVPRKRFGIDRDSIAKTYLPELFGGIYDWSIYFLIWNREDSFEKLIHRNRRYFWLIYYVLHNLKCIFSSCFFWRFFLPKLTIFTQFLQKAGAILHLIPKEDFLPDDVTWKLINIQALANILIVLPIFF